VKAVTRGRESYERYVRKSFEERVFSEHGFETVLAQIRSDCVYGMAAVENRLLVALYDDIRPGKPELRFQSFQAQYRTSPPTWPPRSSATSE